MKPKEFLNGSFHMTPNTFYDTAYGLDKSAIMLMIYLHGYFSSVTGRKLGYKNITIPSLIKELKYFSRNTVITALSQVQKSEAFLIHENKITSPKTLTIFINNPDNQLLFNDIKNGKKSIEISNKNYLNISEMINQCTDEENHSTDIKSKCTDEESHSTDIDKQPSKATIIESQAPLEKAPIIDIKNVFNNISNNNKNLVSNAVISQPDLTLKIEKVKSKLKDFGVVGIDNLIKYNSLEIIEKQIMYHEFREFKNGSLLYNAIKNNEDAPAEYLAHLRFEENQAWVRKYYNFYSLFGINPTGNANDRKKELTKFLLHNLYQFGYLELNIPALNQELRFHQADNVRFIENRVIKPIKYFLANFKIDELITILENGLEILRKDILQCDRKDTIFKCFDSLGVNVFNLKKSILKINSMELTNNENK